MWKILPQIQSTRVNEVVVPLCVREATGLVIQQAAG